MLLRPARKGSMGGNSIPDSPACGGGSTGPRLSAPRSIDVLAAGLLAPVAGPRPTDRPDPWPEPTLLRSESSTNRGGGRSLNDEVDSVHSLPCRDHDDVELAMLMREALRDTGRPERYGPGFVGRPEAPADPGANGGDDDDDDATDACSGSGGRGGGFLADRDPPKKPPDENMRPATAPPMPGSRAGAIAVIVLSEELAACVWVYGPYCGGVGAASCACAALFAFWR
jgi:hypothetical protein